MSGAHVFIDRSQFPDRVRRDLLDSLRTRAINHKFHYESHKQAAKWLALHEAYSPARNDESCLRIYDDAFATATSAANSERLHVVGLGCGGGQKEARLLRMLRDSKRKLLYTACDVSLPLVLEAREVARAFVPDADCHAVVCDLAAAEDLTTHLKDGEAKAPRLVTLFGIVPNFEPGPLLQTITLLLRANDLLLLSVNLAPGHNYADGVRTMLPQYDNALTRDWLMTLLLDLGFERDDGEMSFTIETDSRQLRRITAHFELRHSRDIRVFNEAISFRAGERIRVFFSYRHTATTMRSLLSGHGIEVSAEWLNESREEGVFLCRKG